MEDGQNGRNGLYALNLAEEMALEHEKGLAPIRLQLSEVAFVSAMMWIWLTVLIILPAHHQHQVAFLDNHAVGVIGHSTS